MMKTATTGMKHIRTRIKIVGDKHTHKLSRSVEMLLK